MSGGRQQELEETDIDSTGRLREQVSLASWAASQAHTPIAYGHVKQQGYRRGEVAQYLARVTATLGTLIGRLSELMNKDDRMWRELETLNRKVRGKNLTIYRLYPCLSVRESNLL